MLNPVAQAGQLWEVTGVIEAGQFGKMPLESTQSCVESDWAEEFDFEIPGEHDNEDCEPPTKLMDGDRMRFSYQCKDIKTSGFYERKSAKYWRGEISSDTAYGKMIIYFDSNLIGECDPSKEDDE
ncbi:hypothetical protein P2G88_19000 [Aliiglaciecola sp. CAU 1673]|uniref:DUF3617 domain-containing protein n=1 Tax=Aliiglaciecola sp. CAU 1673 TaxID=3032595 RepID=UPI0023D99FEC|nr:DUF3617 family protein [Aliiglaciecola sp. CAU 1673]MDF2180351.1 hypothetical protein [Aliiglaciecola sp. CAU 1673]